MRLWEKLNELEQNPKAKLIAAGVIGFILGCNLMAAFIWALGVV